MRRAARPGAAARVHSVRLAFKVLAFTVLVPGTVAVYVPYRISGGTLLAAVAKPGGLSALALLPLLVGAAVYLRCAWDFAAGGQGTPAPVDPPRRLVVRGLYRFTRNPMYLGVLSVLGAEAILTGSAGIAGYAATLWLLFHLFVVLYEEPTLRARFEREYEAYCKAVPRWRLRLRPYEPMARAV